ncbi:MAG: rod shape-determining protein RodA [Calditrichaeota bacterium]|nr:rod shape-determining protein RodA [Calditrichota bacterium]
MAESWLKRIDPWLLIAVFGLIGMGLVALYSSSYPAIQTGKGTNYFMFQVFWVIVGTMVMVLVALVPHRTFFNVSYLFYGISIALLILVLFVGTRGMGATRWLRLGPFNIQPSEIAKVATLMAVARYLSSERININQLRYFLTASLFFLIPFLLIVKQPDLGTSLVFVVMVLPVFYWAGLNTGNLFLIIIPFLTLIASFNYYAFFGVMAILVVYLIYSRRPLRVAIFNFLLNIFIGMITPFLWNQLQPYQKKRILTFANPESDPLGAGYQVIQSMVAIGSGGLTGKGFLQGSQTQLRFLPEQHTDFIFAVIGEEFGFLGVTLGLVLFALLLFRIFRIASLVKSQYFSILSVGIATVIGFHMVINIGMTIGLLPVTGLPLPFISYGGSAMLTNLGMVGMLLNFYRNRFEY